jgi:hypothetical protein
MKMVYVLAILVEKSYHERRYKMDISSQEETINIDGI